MKKFLFLTILSASVLCFSISCASSSKLEKETPKVEVTSQNLEDENKTTSDAVENTIPEEPKVYDEVVAPKEDVKQEDEQAEKKDSEEIPLEKITDEKGAFLEEIPKEDKTKADETVDIISDTEDIPLLTEDTTANTFVPVRPAETSPDSVKPIVTTTATEKAHVEKTNADDSDKNTAETTSTKSITITDGSTPVTDKINTDKENSTSDSSQNTTEISSLPVTNSSSSNTESIKTSEKKEIVPSRSVEMYNSQYLDVVYPGTGWVYLGETGDNKLMRYFGRKIGTGDTSFTLRSSKAGSTTLHFYKNDILTGEYIDDYLDVKVKDEKSKTTDHATAPSYEDYVPPRLSSDKKKSTSINAENNAENSNASNIKSENVISSNKEKTESTEKTISSPKTDQSIQSQNTASEDESNVQTLIQTTESTPSASEKASASKTTVATTSAKSSSTSAKENSSNLEDTTSMSENDILSLAQKSFNNKKYSETLSYLDDFFDKAVSRVDEGLYLQGQTYEANSEVKNIKKALETYQTLIDNYPNSIDWDKANERITYLKRFYFNIR